MGGGWWAGDERGSAGGVFAGDVDSERGVRGVMDTVVAIGAGGGVLGVED